MTKSGNGNGKCVSKSAKRLNMHCLNVHGEIIKENESLTAQINNLEEDY